MTEITTTKDLVSIIIPVYNVENYIKDCIQSVLNQTYNNIEIILIDDLGTDNSIQIASDILSKEQVLWKVIHHKKNRGLSAARNTGIQFASGKFAYFLDSDDMITPDCISLLVNKAMESAADTIFGNYMLYVNGSLKKGHTTRNCSFAADEKNPLLAFVMGKSNVVAWNRLFNLEWYKNTGIQFIEGILHEDTAWSLAYALRSQKIAYVNEITYWYRQRENSIMSSTSNSQKSIESIFIILKEACKELNQVYQYAWPIESRRYYFEWKWVFAFQIWNSDNNNRLSLLKKLFSEIIIPRPPATTSLIKLFFILKTIFSDHFAFVIIAIMYNFYKSTTSNKN